MDEQVKHYMGKYLEALYLWCGKEFPFVFEKVYHELRGRTLARCGAYCKRGEESIAIQRCKDKTQKLWERLRIDDPDDLFV
jgi:hypothetical protein